MTISRVIVAGEDFFDDFTGIDDGIGRGVGHRLLGFELLGGNERLDIADVDVFGLTHGGRAKW